MLRPDEKERVARWTGRQEREGGRDWSRCVLCAGVQGKVIQFTVRAAYEQHGPRSAA